MRFTNQQRRRLAAKAKSIAVKGLFEIGTLVTSDTLLRWHKPDQRGGHRVAETVPFLLCFLAISPS
jgi:hypothetical protein